MRKSKQNTTAISRVWKQSLIIARAAAPVVLKPRALTHAAVIAAVGLVVFAAPASSTHTAAVNIMAQRAGTSAVLDATASANVAASVAAKTNLLVSADATKQATTLNSQVALPTSDDNTLAKRQVVATAGDATRGITSYVVASGDTLSQIATKFNLTTKTLLWANNMDDADSIKPGQKLTILPTTGLLYTVSAGDTADSLASKFQSNAAQILSYNNAEVKGLSAGQKIIIPDGVKQEVVKPVAAATAVAVNTITSYARPFLGGANGYAYGYCTYYAKGRRPDIGSYWGNASTWGYYARGDGYAVDHNPTPGSIAWMAYGYYGHVAYVEQVSGGQVLVSEMNYAGNWNRVTSRWTSPGEWSGFIH